MSIVKTNKFQTLDGLTYNVPIQVVTSSLGTDLGTTDTSTSDRTNANASYVIASNTTTWTDTSNLQLTITPKFASSIIKLNLSIFLYSGLTNCAGIRVKRGNKIVFRPTLNTTGPFGTGFIGTSGGNTDGDFQHYLEFYDSPATTSPVTYSLQYRAYSSATTPMWFGFQGATLYSPANYFTATEIAQ